MIKSRGAKGKARVTFTVDPQVGAQTAAVSGEWNDWSADADVMERDADGGFRVTVSLDAGRAYRFRYLLDGQRWDNDWAADAYQPNDFGGDDSVVDLTALAEAVPPAAKKAPAKKETPKKKAAAKEAPPQTAGKDAAARRSRRGGRTQRPRRSRRGRRRNSAGEALPAADAATGCLDIWYSGPAMLQWLGLVPGKTMEEAPASTSHTVRVPRPR